MAKEKADAALHAAEKRLKQWSVFSNKYEDALSSFETAANNYKLAKCWDEAANAFERMSHCNHKLGEEFKHDAATNLVEASKCYRKSDNKKAQECLEQATHTFLEMGRMAIAAKHFKEMGEIAENDGDEDTALHSYERAADLFSGEEQTSSASQCKQKVGHIAANKEEFEKAINTFIEIAESAVTSHLLKYSVKSYLLNAGICALCHYDTEGVKNMLERFEDIDATFTDTREQQLLSELVQAYEQGNAEKFTAAVQEYDSMTKLDSWKTTLLLKAKKRVAASELEGEDFT